MIRNTWIAIVVCVLGLSAPGARAQDAMPQEVAAGPFLLGLRAGATMSWMDFKDSHLLVEFDDEVRGEIQMQDSRRFGGTIGAAVAYEAASNWRLETRVLYATQGSVAQGSNRLQLVDFPNDVLFGTYTARFVTRYVNIPVLAITSLGAPTGRFYLGAGPTFGFLVSARLHEEVRFSIQGTDDRGSASSDADIKDDMTGTNTSLTVLGGWQSTGSRVRGFVEIGYDIGFTNLFNDDVGFEDVRHRGFTFTAGLGY